MANVYNKPIVVLGGGAELPIDNGVIYEGKYRVRYFDIDGTILKIEYVAAGGTLNPPTNPSYDPDYLIFDEWNYDIENYIVEQPKDIYATYKTVDDVTYLFIKLTEKIGLTIPTMKINGAISIDWGDGTIDTNLTHSYEKYGEYIIKISGMTNIKTCLFDTAQNVYTYCLKKCYLSNGVTSIGNSAFSNFYSIKYISIPKSVTSIGNSAFSNCYSLEYVSIPKGVTSIGTYLFSNCYSLKNIAIPKSITSIVNSVFYSCYSLKDITIPESVISIGSNVFAQCYTVVDYIFNFNSVPTLTNNNAFNIINRSAIMWVKDDIINQLKVATNWSDYASYMKPLSWYPSLTNPNA